MTDKDSESIKEAASKAIRQGSDIRSQVHDLTLLAIEKHRFDRQGVRAVLEAVTEGVAHGAEQRSGSVREALSEALHGLDRALRTSAEAGQAALKQLTTTGKDFSDIELRQALSHLRKLEEEFFATVGQVADAAGERVQPELRALLATTRRTGTETGKHVAGVMNEFAHRASIASLDATIAGIEVAGEFGSRFAALASGILSGVADALRKPGAATIPPTPERPATESAQQSATIPDGGPKES
ncbi:MAG: DUF6781 family protein [Burkholderiales bacterium]